MTVTIKVNYQTTFQKKEAKTSINRRESEMLFFRYTEAWQEDPEWRMIALHLEKKEHLD
ncbi:hypothetical protein WKI17_00655 [Streptococcus pneumoniae]|uniref:hypothetical protein n=1 Tax=Streptococcus pseudopneumoniae TaxID=257758 RepID=UPI00312413C2